MIKAKTGSELQRLKAKRQAMYRQIKDVVLPVDWDCKVFIGGCVERGVGSSFRRQAHAHNFKQDSYFGWICVRSIKRIGQYRQISNDDGTLTIIIDKPSMLLIHEYAHILTPNHWHDDIWRGKVRELGGQIDKQYKKQK